MKYTTLLTGLIPLMALASPIWTRDSAVVTVPRMGIKSLATQVDVKYNDGIYDIFAVVLNDSATNNLDFSYKKLSFPIPNGKLAVLDGTGALVGTVVPQGNSFTFDLNSEWANDPTKNSEPKILSTHSTSNSLQKRALFGRFFKRPGNFGVVMDLNKAINDWAWAEFITPRLEKEREEEEAKNKSQVQERREGLEDNQLFLPVFIQGPGVTFEGALGLDKVEFLGKTINTVAEGELFIDIDNVADFSNCALCLIPISGV